MLPRHTVTRFRCILLTGLPGVGKTTFGRAYAAHSCRSFVDLDAAIEKEQGRSIEQIFRKDGEETFREIEQHCLHRFARQENVVLALGGGALRSDEAVKWVKEHGLLVHLQLDLPTLAACLFAEKDKRPLFAAAETEDEVASVLAGLAEDRLRFYVQSHICLDLRFSTVDNAKLELSAFERRAFRKSRLRELAALGEESLEVPSVSAHLKRRYVLREKPYLAAAGILDGGAKGRKKATGTKIRKGAAARTKRAAKASADPIAPSDNRRLSDAQSSERMRPHLDRAEGREHNSDRRSHSEGLAGRGAREGGTTPKGTLEEPVRNRPGGGRRRLGRGSGSGRNKTARPADTSSAADGGQKQSAKQPRQGQNGQSSGRPSTVTPPAK